MFTKLRSVPAASYGDNLPCSQVTAHCDAEYLAPGVAGITAYGWRKCQLDAVLARLLG